MKHQDMVGRPGWKVATRDKGRERSVHLTLRPWWTDTAEVTCEKQVVEGVDGGGGTDGRGQKWAKVLGADMKYISFTNAHA